MCISKGSDQCTGNYICEVGGGIKKEVGGRKEEGRSGGRVQGAMCLG